MKSYTGNYVGIVVQNDDPDKRGRIKVFVPHISSTVYKNWNQTVEDKFFTAPNDDKNNAKLSNVLEDLKSSLPWAEYAGPIIGSCSTGRFNAITGKTTTCDTSYWENNERIEGFRPSRNYIDEKAYPDAFSTASDGVSSQNINVNPYAHEYTPSDYSGLARGTFSIPNVGAHVWVFFRGGDVQFPVYFAAAYGTNDVRRIYTTADDPTRIGAPDYPGSYENRSKLDGAVLDSDTKTFRAKTVLNTNKHTIELIDTDQREIMKFTHYSGSFKEFNNAATIELATNNDQKMVIGDQFLTVRRDQNLFVAMTQDNIIQGDRFKKIGNTNKDNQDRVKKILDIHRQIHNVKRLFDIQRATYGEVPDEVSTLQKRVGMYAPCPTCGGVPFEPYGGVPGSDWGTAGMLVIALSKYVPYFTPICHPWEGAPELPVNVDEDTVNPDETVLTATDLIELFCPAPIAHPFAGLVGYYGGGRCGTCNGTGRISIPGYSPSSEGGTWNREPWKTSQGIGAGSKLDKLIGSKSANLALLERELGEGGDEIINVAFNKVETIGLAMNDLPSFRTDPYGKIKIDGCWVSSQITYSVFKPSPHVEYVDVADIPGGDYNLTCSNKYKLLVGSRGVNIKTTGPIDMFGTIFNLNGEQVNVGARNELTLDGGERITMRGRKLSLMPFEHSPVVVEGQLHITRNMIVQGGALFEGEIGLMHVTAPTEWKNTSPDIWGMPADQPTTYKLSEEEVPLPMGMDALPLPSGAKLMLDTFQLWVETPGMIQIPTASIPFLVQGVEVPCKFRVPRHYHPYKSIPTKLTESRERVRESMMEAGINDRARIVASFPTGGVGGCDSLLYASAIATPSLAEAEDAAPSGSTVRPANITSPYTCSSTEGVDTYVTSYRWSKPDGTSGTITVTAVYDTINNKIKYSTS